MTKTKGVPAEDFTDREIVVSRVFDAPRELVWEAWTDPKHLTRWWGPRGFTTTVHEMDLRPGGIWRHTMHGPDGADYPTDGNFLEVVRPERISYRMKGGKKGDVQFESTWTFESVGEKTRLTLTMRFPSREMLEHAEKTYGVTDGGHQTLGRFAELVAQIRSGRR